MLDNTDVTPNGLADAVMEHRYFAQPEKVTMRMEALLDVLAAPRGHNGIHYVMHQNSNFTHQFHSLWQDVCPLLRFVLCTSGIIVFGCVMIV